MVKVDFSRDYYADLELSSSSDVTEIKRQYKKLALVYHPDRNIGKSNLDTTKFQRIQSAYEVLIDSTERAKYDANRRVGVFRTGTSNRGNPWSHVGREYPPPPRPPTARYRQAPPPSNGARRYDKFATPQQTAYQASQEGPQARKATYDAWENMRSHHGSDKTEPNLGSNSGAPRPPPRGTPQSGRGDPDSPRSASFNNSRDPFSKTKPYSTYTPSTRKNGFMPRTPGGDERPAPRGAYFTQRDKKDAPPIPPRNTEPNNKTSEATPQFRSKADSEPVIEPRISTPYVKHGGERINPFEASPAHLKKSRSSHETEDYVSIKTNSPVNKSIPKDGKSWRASRGQSFTGKTNTGPVPLRTPMMGSSDSEGSPDTPSSTKSGNLASPTWKRAPDKFGEATPKITSKVPETKQRMNEPPKFPPSNIRHSGSAPALSEHIKANPLGNETNITKSPCQKPKLTNSAENISTKFTAKDWDGKFAAGSDLNYFEPMAIPGQISPHRVPSNARARTRSPTKPHTSNVKSMNAEDTHETPAETVFSPAEWAETFKPQTFMPPSVPVHISVSSSYRKKSGPSSRPTIVNANVAGVGAGPSADDKPTIASHEPSHPNATATNTVTPEPMDIDTPHTPTTNHVVPKLSEDHPQVNVESQKRRVSYPTYPPNETDVQASALKINFSDLKIKDLLLDFPLPPNPPMLPQEKKPSANSYLEYELRYKQYMAEWDQFDKKFLLHFVARKNNNEQLGEKRWKGDEVKAYRTTIREDQAVLKQWSEAKHAHEKVVKDWIILKDLRREFDHNERPRKKTA